MESILLFPKIDRLTCFVIFFSFHYLFLYQNLGTYEVLKGWLTVVGFNFFQEWKGKFVFLIITMTIWFEVLSACLLVWLCSLTWVKCFKMVNSEFKLRLEARRIFDWFGFSFTFSGFFDCNYRSDAEKGKLNWSWNKTWSAAFLSILHSGVKRVATFSFIS